MIIKYYYVETFENDVLKYSAKYEFFKDALKAAIKASPSSLMFDIIDTSVNMLVENEEDVNCRFDKGSFTLEITTAFYKKKGERLRWTN